MGKKIRKFIENKRIGFLLVAVLGIFIDVFIFKFTSDVVILTLTGLWIGAVIGWKLEGRFSILGALIFLTMCPFLLIFKQEAIAEKAAIWAYMFLVVGVIQQLIEFKKEPKNLRDFDQFIKGIGKTAKAFGQGFVKTRAKLKGKSAEELAEETGSWLGKLSIEIPQKLKKIGKNSRFAPEITWIINRAILIFNFIFKFWFLLSFALLMILIFIGAGKEITFYHRFFENQYWQQIWQKMGIWLAIFWASLLFSFWILRRQKSIKTKQVLVILLLFIFWRGNAIIFSKTRKEFMDLPYILRISPAIASKYTEVKIYGRNFRDLPFVGKVLIDSKEQAIKSIDNERSWSNQEIIMIVDPQRSQSGQLEVWASWGDKWEKSNSVDFTYYDSKTATPEEEKIFWESLKE